MSKKLIIKLSLSAFICVYLLISNTFGQVGMVKMNDRIEISNSTQKIVFSKEHTSDTYNMTTYVKNDRQWELMFDSPQPLVKGDSFNLLPASYKVIEDCNSRKAILFSGIHNKSDYKWDMLIEALADSTLIKFTITCHLTNDLTITSPQPNTAFWMDQPAPQLAVDQGPMSIYATYAPSFPAAYLWHQNKEAVVFFNLTPMTWMSPQGVARFYDCRVRTVSNDGKIGIGLFTSKLTGSKIPKGDLIIEYYLHAAYRPEMPSKSDALDTMIKICAPLHPARADKFPTNYTADKEVSWTFFAKKTMETLSTRYDPANPSRISLCAIKSITPWNDDPLQLCEPVDQLCMQAGSPTQWIDDNNKDGKPDGPALGDFSLTNNHLSPWILYTRLNHDPAQIELARVKKNVLPLFYDPKAGIIRHGIRHLNHIGDFEMSWQNFFFHLETIRTYEVLPTDDFNPAIAGRFLMAADSLIEYAHNVNYVFPQWFDPYKKTPVIQVDVPTLGKVYEPWQVGTYSYIMLLAYQMTNESRYLSEAKESVKHLFTDMSFTVSNKLYTITYNDPMDFPITELFGNAYGTVSAYKIYELTGDKNYLKYSRTFLNTLLRLTFWYEDKADEVSKDLGILGIFLPHGGGAVATPWESCEAYLAISWILKHDQELPIKQLLLKLANVYRVNSFYFFPPTWSDTVLAKPAKLDHRLTRDIYLPVEPFYSSIEGTGGHAGSPAAYMANMSMWNYWMYEALAIASDRDILILNLDTLENYQAALKGLSRHFIVFNPTEVKKEFLFTSKHLEPGEYEITIKNSSSGTSTKNYNHKQLTAGLSLNLESLDHVRITIQRRDTSNMQPTLQEVKRSQDMLSYAYQLLQQTAGKDDPASLNDLKRNFKSAMNNYKKNDYGTATNQADRIINDLKNRK